MDQEWTTCSESLLLKSRSWRGESNIFGSWCDFGKRFLVPFDAIKHSQFVKILCSSYVQLTIKSLSHVISYSKTFQVAYLHKMTTSEVDHIKLESNVGFLLDVNSYKLTTSTCWPRLNTSVSWYLDMFHCNNILREFSKQRSSQVQFNQQLSVSYIIWRKGICPLIRRYSGLYSVRST